MNIKVALLTSMMAMTIVSSAYAMKPGDGSCGGQPPGTPSVAHLQEILELSDEQAESL